MGGYFPSGLRFDFISYTVFILVYLVLYIILLDYWLLIHYDVDKKYDYFASKYFIDSSEKNKL